MKMVNYIQVVVLALFATGALNATETAPTEEQRQLARSQLSQQKNYAATIAQEQGSRSDAYEAAIKKYEDMVRAFAKTYPYQVIEYPEVAEQEAAAFKGMSSAELQAAKQDAFVRYTEADIDLALLNNYVNNAYMAGLAGTDQTEQMVDVKEKVQDIRNTLLNNYYAISDALDEQQKSEEKTSSKQ